MIARAPLRSGSSSQGIELFGQCEVLRPGLSHQLAFLQHGHELNADQVGLGCLKRLESEHWTGGPFHCPVILFDDVVEVFDLVDFDAVLGSWLYLLIAASLASLPSIVIVSGAPFRQSPS